MPFSATWMDLEIVLLREISQIEKEISYHILYMWNLKRNDTNEHTCKAKRLTDLINEFMVAGWEG